MICRHRFIIAFLLVVLLPVTALGQLKLHGEITAERGGGSLGAWVYTMVVNWDTGTPYGLSHLNLIFDDGTNCECEEVLLSIRWGDPAGHLIREGGSQLYVDHELNCTGDPSINLQAPLFKFLPREFEGNEAGPTGEMTVVFYSDFPPADIAEPNLFLVDKYAQYSDFGMVTGVFPGLSCDPVYSEPSNWGGLKSLYR